MNTLLPGPRSLSVYPVNAVTRPRRRWVASWFGIAALAVANGIIRDTAYPPSIDAHAAHQLSTVSLLALITGYAWLLQRRWPLATTEDAVAVGLTWTAMTLFFEFGFGHYVDGASWATLIGEYDLAAGNLWVLVPLAVGLAPWLSRRYVRR